MMMNSILGVEPATGGKAASAASENSNKSNGSSDFSNYMTAEQNQGNEAGAARSPDGESPVAESAEEADAKSVETDGNKESSSHGEEKADLPANSDNPSEADPDIAAPGLEQVTNKVSEVTDLPDHAQAEGTVSTAQNAASADAIDETITAASHALQRNGTQKAARSTGEAGSATAKQVAHGDAQPAQAGRNTGEGQLAGSPEPSAGAETQVPETEGALPQEPRSVRGKDAVYGSAAASPEAVAARKAAATEISGSRLQIGAGGQKGANPYGGAEAVEDAVAAKVEDAVAAKTVSGKPNVQAVEQMQARQPEGVAWAVAGGAKGAVQSLAAALPASRDTSRNSDLGSVSIKVSEDISAEAHAESKPGSGTSRTGQFNTVPAVQAAPQASVMFQPLLAAGLAENAGEADLPFHALGLSGEAPGLSQLLAEASFGSHTVHRPEMPRMIAAQIAEAFAAKGEQKVEVSLNPQELGHVKMRVVTSENGITMIIQTERPETGDLMRRHINELAEEFRRMGYEDISFEFSGGQAGSGGDGDGTDEGAGHDGGAAGSRTDGAEAAGEQAIQNLRLGSAGVDMRV